MPLSAPRSAHTPLPIPRQTEARPLPAVELLARWERALMVFPGVFYECTMDLGDHLVCGLTMGQGMPELLGLQPAELLGRHFCSLIVPEDRAILATEIERCRREGSNFLAEYRVHRPDTTTIWVRDRAWVEFLPGDTVRRQGYLLDITAERLAQDRLRHQEELLASVFDGTAVAMVMVDVESGPTFRFRMVNPAFARITGLEREWIEGRTTAELFPRVDRDGIAVLESRYAACLEQGQTLTFEDPYQVDGVTDWWLLQLSPAPGAHGRKARLIGSAIRITERKQAESALEEAHRKETDLSKLLVETANRAHHARLEAERADRVKSEYLAILSHEIRTPINAISGFTELLQDCGLRGDAKEYADRIAEASDGLFHLINQVIDYSQMETGQFPLEPAPTVLREEVEAVLRLLEAKARAKAIDLRVVYDADLPVSVMLDALRFRQILINLLFNAIKFTEVGEVVLALNFGGPTLDGRLDLAFEVRDTGPGISPEDQERMFKPFQQTRGGRRKGGSGLGLAICRNLVERMGGRIGLRSAPGEGTTFFFNLVCDSTGAF